DVERLAEAEPELALRDGAGDTACHAPAGARCRARCRGAGGSRSRGEEKEECGKDSASPARACRRRRVLHWQQPTQLLLEMLHCKLPWTAPRAPVALLSDTFSPREAVCAVPYSQLSPEPPTA